MKSRPAHTRTITDEMLPFSGVFEFHITALNAWVTSPLS